MRRNLPEFVAGVTPTPWSIPSLLTNLHPCLCPLESWWESVQTQKQSPSEPHFPWAQNIWKGHGASCQLPIFRLWRRTYTTFTKEESLHKKEMLCQAPCLTWSSLPICPENNLQLAGSGAQEWNSSGVGHLTSCCWVSASTPLPS